jgi:hypothetical protein
VLTLNEHASLVAAGVRLDAVILALGAQIDAALKAHGGFAGDEVLVLRLQKLCTDTNALRTMLAALPTGNALNDFDIEDLS